jgi:hypothetical protein
MSLDCLAPSISILASTKEQHEICRHKQALLIRHILACYNKQTGPGVVQLQCVFAQANSACSLVFCTDASPELCMCYADTVQPDGA